MTSVRKNFSHHELACRCCGEMLCTGASLDALQNLRDLAGVPLYIATPGAGGYRCPRGNRLAGGVKNSQHVAGTAYDLRWPMTYSPAEFVEMAASVGFTGFGFYDTFIHVDKGPSRLWDERQQFDLTPPVSVFEDAISRGKAKHARS